MRPPDIGRHWEAHGTWMRPPLLIDQRLLNPADSGLQVLEGRTRVGVLRGHHREQLRVAPPPGMGGTSVRTCRVSLRTLRVSRYFRERAVDD
ncbi:hypothetical protein ACFQLX_19680 [Streptomyces polyrhachis]|uniref:Uncharacterized protein n=1 Tax=Streptomyces polyrhachis TaxID=1282885 RepID=A0ABW2GL19_9ACTN